MEVVGVIITILVVCAAAIGYAIGRVCGAHELRYQRRMAEQWYVAYRQARRRVARVTPRRAEGDEWKHGGDSIE